MMQNRASSPAPGKELKADDAGQDQHENRQNLQKTGEDGS